MERIRNAAVPIAVVIAAVASIAAMMALVVRNPPLVNDEPLYAARGLGLGVIWPGYRAPGLPFVASLIGSGNPMLLRSATVLSMVVLAVSAGLLTWRLSRNAVAGWIGAGLVISAPGLIQTAVQFLPDVPGTLLVVLAVLVVVLSIHEDRLSWWSLAAVPITLAANYMRFSASVPILAGIVSIALFRRSVFQRSKAIVVALGIGLILVTGVSNFLPQPGSDDGRSAWSANQELIEGKAETLEDRGRSLVLSSASTVGLERQISSLTPAGVLYAVGCGVALLAAVWKWRSAGPYLLWAALTLAVYIVTLGHFEVRYMVPVAVPLLCAAAVGVSEVMRDRQVVLAAAVGSVCLAGVAFGADQAMRIQDMETEPRQALVEAGEFIRSVADGRCTLRKTLDDDHDVNAEGYVGLTAVAVVSGCDVDPDSEHAFVVQSIPSGESPARPPLFERSYRYFDVDAATWRNQQTIVFRGGGEP